MKNDSHKTKAPNKQQNYEYLRVEHQTCDMLTLWLKAKTLACLNVHCVLVWNVEDLYPSITYYNMKGVLHVIDKTKEHNYKALCT